MILTVYVFLLNGELIKGDVESDLTNDVGSASNIAAAINAKTAKTGVFATVSSEVGKEGEYTLTASDGRNIVLSKNAADITKAAEEAGLTPDSGSTWSGDWGNTGIEEAVTGTAAVAAVAATIGPNATPAVAAVPAKAATLTKFEMHPAGAVTTASALANGDSAVVYGKIELTTDSLAGITLGGPGATPEVLGIAGEYIAASKSSGSGVGSVNLNTASGAQSALTTLDRAINAVTDMRASMGAYQNRLTASIANLENTSMNLTASRSRILDTDYAKETTNLAKSQIIQQAATAMLAQANQSSQSVLALLK
jgi:flagellin